ncbi:AAA family ATPase [Methanococcus voltae]|uniref:DNA repair and recombination protein RadB n=1 Tax=Methanococcus voltae (strain ATCC BAA-1334 / A3) TaxID=456320 RepID=D7DSA9_METV3|nr:AAA family ATPase [Methanococcus voltae]MCS3901545.1 DNA repair protein RadB [Methanococcus voltae]
MLKGIINGEIEKKTITQIYGPPGSGKTNICIIAMIKFAKNNQKVIYIDTEGSLSTERVKQICPQDSEGIFKNTLLCEPYTFEEQCNVIESLEAVENIGLIIVDGISSLYRLELSNNVFHNTELNRNLARQIHILNKIAKKNDTAVLLTNQAKDSIGYKSEPPTDYKNKDFSEENETNGKYGKYGDLKSNKISPKNSYDDSFEPTGGKLLAYWSKSILKLEKFKNFRRLTLEKHRFHKDGEYIDFQIVQHGLEELSENNESKDFKDSKNDMKKQISLKNDS